MTGSCWVVFLILQQHPAKNYDWVKRDGGMSRFVVATEQHFIRRAGSKIARYTVPASVIAGFAGEPL